MRLIIVLLVVAGFMVVAGYREIRLSGKCKKEPQTLLLSELLANGYGDNANVQLEGFVITPGEFAVKTSKGSDEWKSAWIPIVAYESVIGQQIIDAREKNTRTPVLRGEDLRCILMFKDLKDGEREIDRLMNGEKFQGVIVNDIESLGSEEKKILQNTYRGVNLDKCYLFHVNREPGSAMKGVALAGGGGAVGLVGLGVGAMGFRKKK